MWTSCPPDLEQQELRGQTDGVWHEVPKFLRIIRCLKGVEGNEEFNLLSRSCDDR